MVDDPEHRAAEATAEALLSTHLGDEVDIPVDLERLIVLAGIDLRTNALIPGPGNDGLYERTGDQRFIWIHPFQRNRTCEREALALLLGYDQTLQGAGWTSDGVPFATRRVSTRRGSGHSHEDSVAQHFAMVVQTPRRAVMEAAGGKSEINGFAVMALARQFEVSGLLLAARMSLFGIKVL